MVTQEPIPNDESSEDFNWETFLTSLQLFVQQELSGTVADLMFPDLPFHIRTSPECQQAYYRELRRQSLLLATVNPNTVEGMKELAMLDKLFNTPTQPISEAQTSNWVEQIINHGRGWLEEGSRRWRQLEISFTGLHLSTTASPLLIGTMSEERTDKEITMGEIHVIPQDANFELSITVSPDTIVSNQSFHKMEVMVTLSDRFGDYSGVDLILSYAEVTKHSTTNSLGHAIFTRLPTQYIQLMTLNVSLPD